MELSDQESVQRETVEQKTKFFAPLFQVTKLSKYFAILLFVMMPFIGGWVGYWYGSSNQPCCISQAIYQFEENQLRESVNVSRGQDDARNHLSSNKSYFISEEIQLSIKPFSDYQLEFEVSAYRNKSAPFFTDHTIFKPETGEIVLQNYYSSSSGTERLLQLYAYNGESDIEKYIEDRSLQEFARQSDTTVDVQLAAYSESIKELVQKIEPQKDVSNIDFRSFCKLRENNYNGITTYSLGYDDLYDEPENWTGFICGYTSYIFFDGFVVTNFAQPGDVSQPKVYYNNKIRLVK